jgi:hypothetical protein
MARKVWRYRRILEKCGYHADFFFGEVLVYDWDKMNDVDIKGYYMETLKMKKVASILRW